MRNFKGYLWNSTQNILPIHWTSWILFTGENLRALRFKSSEVFLKRPQGCCQLHFSSVNTIYSLYSLTTLFLWIADNKMFDFWHYPNYYYLSKTINRPKIFTDLRHNAVSLLAHKHWFAELPIGAAVTGNKWKSYIKTQWCHMIRDRTM